MAFCQYILWHYDSIFGKRFAPTVGRSCLAIEVNSTARWQKNDLSGLEAFLAATPHCRAAVLGYNGTEAVQLADKIWALPLDLVLS
jgi:hypothetical protein